MSLLFQLLVVGANWGKIYLLDHQGNIVSNKALKKHSVAVNQISIDISGEFIASCSDDGKVSDVIIQIFFVVVPQRIFQPFCVQQRH